MSNNNSENIKEIFTKMIKEIDENSLKYYVKCLNKFIKKNSNKKIKENKLKSNLQVPINDKFISNSITINSVSVGLLGHAGEQGFGVCEYPDIDSLQWINAMSGSSDKGSKNYGNYRTLNGSVMVCIPSLG